MDNRAKNKQLDELLMLAAKQADEVSPPDEDVESGPVSEDQERMDVEQWATQLQSMTPSLKTIPLEILVQVLEQIDAEMEAKEQQPETAEQHMEEWKQMIPEIIKRCRVLVLSSKLKGVK